MVVSSGLVVSVVWIGSGLIPYHHHLSPLFTPALVEVRPAFSLWSNLPPVIVWSPLWFDFSLVDGRQADGVLSTVSSIYFLSGDPLEMGVLLLQTLTSQTDGAELLPEPGSSAGPRARHVSGWLVEWGCLVCSPLCPSLPLHGTGSVKNFSQQQTLPSNVSAVFPISNDETSQSQHRSL